VTTTTTQRSASLTLRTAAPAPTGLGPQIKPFTAMGLLLIAASAERMAVHLAGHEAELACGTAATAFVIAVVVAMRSKKMDKHLRRRFIAGAWGAAGWLTYVAAAGLTWGAVATLTAVGGLLSLLYLRMHRIYGEAEVLVAEQRLDQSTLYIQRWQRNLAKGDFEGSELTEPKEIGSGYRYTLRLVPGRQSVSKVLGGLDLYGGLELENGQSVIVERHPILPAPQAQLTVVTQSTVVDDQPWPGPERAFDPRNGSVNLGPFVDGEGIAQCCIYRKDGMFGGFLQGSPGSGKSRMVEIIAVACAASISHPTIVWFGCGQNGDSSRMLVRRADRVALTHETMLEMLTEAEKVMTVNGIENRKAGCNGFTPTTERPGLLLIIDEFHDFVDETKHRLANVIQEKMVNIARKGRKVGVALILATQEPKLGAFGNPKHADLLRSCLLNGFGILLRTLTNNAKQIFKVEIDPTMFPADQPGYAFLARPASEARSAPFRGFFVDDAALDQWSGQIIWHELPRRQANYAGSTYANRHLVAQKQSDEDEALLALLDSGMLDELQALSAEMDRVEAQQAERVMNVPSTFGEHMPGFARVAKFWEQSAPVQAGPELNEGQRKVLAAIRNGHRSPKTIANVTGYSLAWVHEAMKTLMQLELIERSGYGEYRIAA
jgi:hypothetical protein